MTILLLLAVVSTSSSTSISVTIDPFGRPRIDAEFGPSGMRPYEVYFGRNVQTVIDERSIVTEPLLDADTGLVIPTINSEPIVGIRNDYFEIGGAMSLIGVGPGSDLLTAGGESIDFVRQSTISGILRLGGTEQDFIANDCLPNSVMRMETFTDNSRRVETRISIAIGENIVATNSSSFVESAGFILTMPQLWLADIYTLLPPSVGEFGSRRVFSNCSHTIQQLPNITLTFSAGGLHLVPQDYTRSIGSNDTCELLIGVMTAFQTVLRINPLMIPGINARSTENEIILCDAAWNQSTPSSTLIPVRFSPYSMPGLSDSPRMGGLPIIDAEHWYGPIRSYVLHLGTAGTSAIPEQEMFHGPLISQLRIPNANGSMIEISDLRNQQMFSYSPLRNRGIDSFSDRRRSTIGIGPGSDLLRFGGQIDFVRQTNAGGFLRLGASEDWFITNDCFPGTVMRISTVMGRTISGHPQVGTRVSVSIEDNIITTDSIAILDSSAFFLTMPHTWMVNIFAELSPFFDRLLSNTVFPGCNQTIQRLPIITLTFLGGELKLEPEDYTRPIGQNDTCELLIGRIPDWVSDQTIRFNPLMIPGINARSTDNEIILCDSVINL